MDWELPKIPEEATEKLHSMFILQTTVLDSQVILKAVDSHPRRMNGFLTGCLLQVRPVPGLHVYLPHCEILRSVLDSYSVVASPHLQVLMEHTPNISDLPKFLTNQMRSEARRSRAHRGIECRAEFSKVGNIWAAPLLPQ